MASYNLDGFVGIRQVQNYSPTQPIFTADALAQAVVTESLDEGESDFLGCNINFDLFQNMNLNIPGADFFALYSVPNLNLFNKADQFSYEISIINDLMISAIEEMGCCDIARKYNTTMVPFFRYFADHPEVNDCGETGVPGDNCSYGTSDNFISVLIEIVKIITQVQSVVEPLLCLIKPLPGNPWLPFDVDFLQWAYSYVRKAPPYVDKILSGEILDIIINPVANFRRKLQMCIDGSNDDTTFFDVKAIGDFNQLSRILAVAERNGSSVNASNIIKPESPKQPDPAAYPDQSSLSNAQREYNAAKEAYDKKILVYEKQKRELDTMHKNNSSLSQYEVDALNTRNVMNQGYGNLCNCAVSALGMENLMPDWIDIHSSRDINNLVDKELNMTYGDVNINDRFHERDDKLVFIDKYIQSDKLKRILIKAEASKRYNEVVIQETTTSLEHPYNDIGSYSNIEVPVYEIQSMARTGNGWDIYQTNEKILTKVSQLRLNAQKTKSKIEAAERRDRDDFDRKRALSGKAIGYLEKRIQDYTYGSATPQYEVSLEKAKSLYNNYFSSWDSYDPGRDKDDWESRSGYIDPNDQDYQQDSVDDWIPEDDSGEISTEVKVDQRTGAIYYNNGITAIDGTLNWRTNNPILIPTNAWTQNNDSIGRFSTPNDYIAIFPTIEIGVLRTIDWIKFNYVGLTLRELAEEIFSNQTYLIDLYILEATRKINQDDTIIVSNLTDVSIIHLIRLAAEHLDFEQGSTWYKDTRLQTVPFVSPEVETQTLINEEVYDNLPQFMQSQINSQVEARGNEYGDMYSGWVEVKAIDDSIQELMDIYNNNTAVRIFYFKPINIPCTCDGFICSLLQMVVSYILGLFNELMKYLANLIIDYLIPDFIRNMIRLVLEKVKCLVALFNIGETLDIIDDAARDLLEDLRWRISLYPDDTCFIPDDLFEEPPVWSDPDNPGNPFTDPEVNPWAPPTEYPPGGDPWGNGNDDNDPGVTLDDPGLIIIGGGGTGNTIDLGQKEYPYNPPDSGNSIPPNGLSIELVLTNGVEQAPLKRPDQNIPTLTFDCHLDQPTTDFTACNQSRESNLIIP